MRNDKDGGRRAMQMRVGVVGVLVGLTLLTRGLFDPTGRSLTWLWIQMAVAIVGILAIVIQRASVRLAESRAAARVQPTETGSAEDEFSSLH